MTLLLTEVVSALWTWAARRPYAAAAVVTAAATTLSIVWFVNGETMAERGAPVWPIIAFLIAAALVAAGWYINHLEALRREMALRSPIVPPPLFVTKPYFWLGFVSCAIFLPAVAWNLGDIGAEDGRTVADGVIVEESDVPNALNKPIHEVVIEFETMGGVVTRGVTRQYGDVAVGDSMQVKYLDSNPSDVKEYDLNNELGVLAIFGTFSVVGLAVAVAFRPRRVLSDIPAPAVDGSLTWGHQTNNGLAGLAQEVHFFAGNTSQIWIWRTGERTSQGLSDWIASGGSLQHGAYAHDKFDLSTVEEVVLQSGKLRVITTEDKLPTLGLIEFVKVFDVAADGETLLSTFEKAYGWTITPQPPVPAKGLRRLFGRKAPEPGVVARPTARVAGLAARR